MAGKTCRRRSQRDQELLCEFVRKSATCAACQDAPETPKNIVHGAPPRATDNPHWK
ncbi:uncharacterized protein [Drosophila pseudoobscura]|uniref:Uncharacterized protein n=1 Tax=Drosophila pseudoobscura pseudoobscura TaxID=46245 RepID=A0A6I8V9J2_DROPS|nr:uncharacterized protein LOC26532384 [Drosophila pseudoobscura]